MAQVTDTVSNAASKAQDSGGDVTSLLADLKGKKLDENGQITDESGNVLAQLKDGNPGKLVGKKVDASGNIMRKGKVVGSIEPVMNQGEDGEEESEGEESEDESGEDEEGEEEQGDESTDQAQDANGTAEAVNGAQDQANGVEEAANGTQEQTEDAINGVQDQAEDAQGEAEDSAKDAQDQAEDVTENAQDQAEDAQGEAEDTAESAAMTLDQLEGCTVDEDGNIWNSENEQMPARVSEGKIKKLAGRAISSDGTIQNKKGKVLGRVELTESEDESDSEGEEEGEEGEEEGQGEEEEEEEEEGQGDGQENGVEGAEAAAEEAGEEGQEAQPEMTLDQLEGCTVNEHGRVVDSAGNVVGGVVEGKIKHLIGRKVSNDGTINKGGRILGKVDLLDNIDNSESEPEQEEEKETTLADLEGLPINERGKVVSSDGEVLGAVTEGKLRKLVDRKVGAEGCVYNKRGELIGRVDLVQNLEEETSEEEGPTEEELQQQRDAEEQKQTLIRLRGMVQGCLDKMRPLTEMIQEKVQKDELPVEELRPLVERSERALSEARGGIYAVDPEEQVIGKAKYDVNQGQSTSEQYQLVDAISNFDEQESHVTDARQKLESYEPEEEGPTEEELEEQRKTEENRERASHMGQIVDATIDKVKPLTNMITEHLNNADRDQKNDNLDEDKLISTVRPLIEQATGILQESFGAIKALDPKGELQAKAKGKTQQHDATSEEYYLADRLSYLTENVQKTIDDARVKIDGMPTKTKKNLGPLLDLLQQPLFQILSAVGLLLSGVLGLVKNLLGGLGLGSIVDNLLGSLGLDKVLDGLGIGNLTG